MIAWEILYWGGLTDLVGSGTCGPGAKNPDEMLGGILQVMAELDAVRDFAGLEGACGAGDAAGEESSSRGNGSPISNGYMD